MTSEFDEMALGLFIERFTYKTGEPPSYREVARWQFDQLKSEVEKKDAEIADWKSRANIETNDNSYVRKLWNDEVKAKDARICELETELKFYAQKPVAEDGTVWSDSCKEWGLQSYTWEPLLDLGKRARSALGGEG